MDLLDPPLCGAKLWSSNCGFGRHPQQRRKDGGVPSGRRKLRQMVGMEKTTREGSKSLRKPAKTVRCTLLYGSAWSTENEYM